MTDHSLTKDQIDPAICGDDGPITPEQCALWLDAKYRRHGELEDRAAAMWLRKLSTRLPAEPSDDPGCPCHGRDIPGCKENCPGQQALRTNLQPGEKL